MTKINVQMETTVNTGNFQNVKLIYGIEDEPRGDERVPDAFNRMKTFVEDRIVESAAEVSEDWEKIRKAKNGSSS